MKEEEKIQWHPAFYEAIQAELVEYRDVLHFEAEHQLTTEPLRIDVLIIRKQPDAVIRKNIAAIFRTINICEFKSPDDRKPDRNAGYDAYNIGYNAANGFDRTF
ncbi:MAG: hypothetical protein LBG12_08925 [Synergistaceae bacterium]|jgi:hypothetical protein|nr:hypothetical protein [Synergistaceae bacterium]